MLVRERVYQGENINNLPLRVTFYARVSTESDEQLNSLDNQITYFENYIKENKNWIYIPGYIDEGISGNTVKKRKKFLKMIEDAQNNLFDLIITKEVSRFSRNLSDSIKYTQILLQHNVGVYFQTNGINTFDPNSEFILNMMASVAQEEVKRLSLRVKWGHKNAIKRGRILGSSNITGYNKQNSILTINEEEANKIRKIFAMYATGKYGLNKLSYELYNQNITNSNNNPIDKETLKRIIENPKYKGYYRGHTTEIIDYRLKKRITIPKEEQTIYKDETIPQIVPEELWKKANEILTTRRKIIKTTKITIYPYTNKLICKEHNTPYYRKKIRQKNIVYACSNYIKRGTNACDNPIIREEDLNEIMRIILNKLIIPYEKEIKRKLLSIYKNTSQVSIDKKIKELTLKKEKLLELYTSNNISKEEFRIRNDGYNEIINNINQKEINPNLLEIEKYILSQLSFKEINKYTKTLLNKIIISKKNEDKTKIKLEIFLNIEIKKTIFNYESKNKSYHIEVFYAKK